MRETKQASKQASKRDRERERERARGRERERASERGRRSCLAADMSLGSTAVQASQNYRLQSVVGLLPGFNKEAVSTDRVRRAVKSTSSTEQ